MFVVHAAQIFNRTITLALLAATESWWVAAYLGCDFLLHVLYKVLRRDLWYWLPGLNVPLSLLARFVLKTFTDSTACIESRSSVDLGGLYYMLNAFLCQAPSVPPAFGRSAVRP